VIKQEIAKLGLLESDAEAIFNSWMMNGFRTGRGNKIKSWKGAINVWHLNKWFPSQKPQPQNGALMTYEKLDEFASWPAFKKLDVHKLGEEFKEWCEKNHKPKLVASFLKLLNARL
jgi:hypothetical protein